MAVAADDAKQFVPDALSNSLDALVVANGEPCVAVGITIDDDSKYGVVVDVGIAVGEFLILGVVPVVGTADDVIVL